jgi:hypothetical protein
VQLGTPPACGEGQGCGAAIAVLDLHSGRWQAGFREHSSEVLDGHAAVAFKNKLVAFGGVMGGWMFRLVHASVWRLQEED